VFSSRFWMRLLLAAAVLALGSVNHAIAKPTAWLAYANPSDEELVLPEFPRQTADAWLNSPPLKAKQLRGKVVLLEVYTTD